MSHRDLLGISTLFSGRCLPDIVCLVFFPLKFSFIFCPSSSASLLSPISLLPISIPSSLVVGSGDAWVAKRWLADWTVTAARVRVAVGVTMNGSMAIVGHSR